LSLRVKGPEPGGVAAVTGLHNEITVNVWITPPDQETVEGVFVLPLEFYPILFVSLCFAVIPNKFSALNIESPG
jgi:hypothetical protein